jgi:pyruvate/2-oxoglutarate dehydrogenase complex dihydrolipoamide dehydrogenase (E3) component
MIVIGGGVIGLEMGSVYSRLGTQVRHMGRDWQLPVRLRLRNDSTGWDRM